jgi:uncharacterized protein YqhQ
MAFGNGVMMRAGRYWAWARDDGSLLHGVVPAWFGDRRWTRLPVVRSLLGFAGMLALSVRLHRRNGRLRSARLLLWLVVLVVASALAGPFMYAHVRPPLLADATMQALGVLLALVVLRLGMGAEVWRFHGAEHMAVNAYEGGADLTDVAAVGAFSRIHDRCGTNLIAIVLLLVLLLVPAWQGWLGELASLAVTVACVAAALEIFRLIQRRPRLLISRAALSVGRALQRVVTTRDPRPDQLALACAALVRVVELESGTTR